MRALNDEFKTDTRRDFFCERRETYSNIKTLTSTDNAIATNSDAIITAIYGIY